MITKFKKTSSIRSFVSSTKQFGVLTPCDGNTAAAHVGYYMSDNAFIYPITPSSSMGEYAESWASEGKENIFGQCTLIKTMQSEGGASGALHGSATVGSLCTTFTASQGLLLMIPNMYKTSGELLPAVFHVAARALSRQALSIYGDHSDVMGVRQTGCALLSSGSVQEVMDLGAIAHMSSVQGKIPFVHFFDGFRLSHEMASINFLDVETMKKLMDMDKVKEFRERANFPEHPHIRGHSQGPYDNFQTEELVNPYYNVLPSIVQKNMEKFYSLTNRKYNLFDYIGHENAERIIVIMGAGAPVVEETVKHLLKSGEKVGVIKVRLYRPWDSEAFYNSIPSSVKKIAVLDRTKESGSIAEPLCLDVLSTLKIKNDNRLVIGGRYGLASKEFDPAMAKAVFDNLLLENPKTNFTVGIHDDVTHLSLPVGDSIDTVPEDTRQCIIFGLGSDGTVSSNKNSIKIIVKKTGNYGQGYFQYTADKSNAVTISYLRFGPHPISSEYLVNKADFIAVHKQTFVRKFDVTKGLRPNGIFVLNTNWDTIELLERNLPNSIKIKLAKKNANLYVINASNIAQQAGMGGKISKIMQMVFFKLTDIMSDEKSLEAIIEDIKFTFRKKGSEIINRNVKAVKNSLKGLKKIEIPIEKWLKLEPEPPIEIKGAPEFINKILLPLDRFEGSELPVSAFIPGGDMPLSTSKYMKKGIAEEIPIWDSETNCIQCNQCAFICPHSAIRPFILSKEESELNKFSTISSTESQFKGKNYRIQVSPDDCTGCTLCTKACPNNCLTMKPYEEFSLIERENWDICQTLTDSYKLNSEMNKFTVKNSQYQQPLLEFPPSCAGCTQTQIVKIITQLFGDRMTIANSSGCSSVWGGRFPVSPYCVNEKGRGPAWGRSLFEDTSEYGYGMSLATQHRRERHLIQCEKILSSKNINNELKSNMINWSEDIFDTERSAKYGDKIMDLIDSGINVEHPLWDEWKSRTDLLIKKSHWVIGGDGFANDIGYGGLDWVVSQVGDVNILVLDTEVYSNTGGQVSGASPLGAVQAFSAGGKEGYKKDLGMMTMQHGGCYVCSIAPSSPKHFKGAIKALKEAESYPGPSLIQVYCNCEAHKILLDGGLKNSIDVTNDVVDSGYWLLYRFDPRRIDDGKNPLVIDSKKPKLEILKKILKKQNRFASLEIIDPEKAHNNIKKLENWVLTRYNKYKNIASMK